MTTEIDVHRIALSFPEASTRPSYEKMPGFFVKKKMFARLRLDPDALVAWRPTIAEKEALIAEQPEKFFQTPHYEGHQAVLVRLEAISLEELENILTLSWMINAPAKLVAAFEAARTA